MILYLTRSKENNQADQSRKLHDAHRCCLLLILSGEVFVLFCRLKRQRQAPLRVLQLGVRAASVLSARDTQGLSS